MSKRRQSEQSGGDSEKVREPFDKQRKEQSFRQGVNQVEKDGRPFRRDWGVGSFKQ